MANNAENNGMPRADGYANYHGHSSPENDSYYQHNYAHEEYHDNGEYDAQGYYDESYSTLAGKQLVRILIVTIEDTTKQDPRTHTTRKAATTTAIVSTLMSMVIITRTRVANSPNSVIIASTASAYPRMLRNDPLRNQLRTTPRITRLQARSRTLPGQGTRRFPSQRRKSRTSFWN